MSKFKVGDKVKLLNTEYAAVNGFEIGNVYEITGIGNSEFCYIELYNGNGIHGFVNDEHIELVEEESKPNVATISIDTNGIKFTYENDHLVDSLSYCINDYDQTDKLKKYIYGVWEDIKNEDKEEKDMNKVLELYAKRKREEIDKKYKEKVEKDYNDLELVKQYKAIIKDFEIKMDELYNSELNAGESTIHQCYKSSDYKYELVYDIKNSIEDVYSE